jgi:hypothetical protein
MIDRFGNVQLGLAAYNAGPGAVENYGGVPPFDKIKDAGFHWATRSGVTVALSDIITPSDDFPLDDDWAVLWAHPDQDPELAVDLLQVQGGCFGGFLSR